MNWVYFTTWIALKIIANTYFYRWRVFNSRNMPMHGPAIVASNHVSFIDPPFIGAASPRELHFLARESLFTNPIGNWYLRALNCVPVDRDGGGGTGLKAILDRLRRGNAIILFPEGTRSPDGLLKPARAGVGLIVIKSGAPVVPCRVFGAYEAWGRKSKYPKPHPVNIAFGKPVYFTEYMDEVRSCSKDRLKEIYQEVADKIMEEIAKLEPCDLKESFP